MKYTLPQSYSQAGTQVNIPDQWLSKAKVANGGSLKGAIDQWLYENGYMTETEHAEQAQATKATEKSSGRKRQPDEAKRALIAGLYAYISSLGDVRDVEVTNVERLIAFSLGDDKYEVTLTKKRKAK